MAEVSVEASAAKNITDGSSSVTRNLVILSLFIVTVSIISFISLQYSSVRGLPDDNQQPEATKSKPLTVRQITVEGTPRLVREGRVTEFNANTQITSRDIIETNEESRIYLLFSDRTSLHLDRDSSIIIDELGTESTSKIITLQTGRVWLREYADKQNSTLQFNSYSIETDATSSEVALESQDVSVYLSKGEKLNVTKKNSLQKQLLSGQQMLSRNNTANIDTLKLKDDWQLYNECLDTNTLNIVNKDSGFDEVYTSLKNLIQQGIKCSGILGISVIATPTARPVVYRQVYVSPKGKPASIYEVKGSVNELDQVICEWNAGGEAVTSYSYSLWRINPDSTEDQLTDWKSTTNKSVIIGEAGLLALVYPEQYVCKVQAFSKWGNAESKSEVFYYDKSTGSLSLYKPDPEYYTQVDGTGIYQNMNLAEVQVRFSLMNTEPTSLHFNQYCQDNNQWGSTAVWFDTIVSEIVPGLFKFENFDVDCDEAGASGVFRIEMINTTTKKLLYNLEFAVTLN